VGWGFTLQRLAGSAVACSIYRSTCTLWIVFGLIVVLAVAACAGAAAEPPAPAAGATQSLVAATQVEAIVPTSVAFTPTPEQPGETPRPEIPETRRLTLEYPPRIRAGDADIVRLTLEVDQSGNITPTAVVQGNVITGQVIEVPNLYETHHVIVEARMDMAGMQISPADLTSQTLSPGQSVMFFWSIRPDDPGVYRGTVWLYLRFVDKFSGEESRKAVSAQTVEIEAVNLLGIPARVIRVAGGLGSLVGTIIGFPFFEDIVKYLFGRRRRRA